MRIVTNLELNDLSRKANSSTRRRQHLNIHENYSEACQRLLNAIEPESYIRPHRHQSDPKCEMLVPLRGLFAVFTFNDLGEILDLTYLSLKDKNFKFTKLIEIPSYL
jgi:cupin fold WbuC family metalloprotein